MNYLARPGVIPAVQCMWIFVMNFMRPIDRVNAVRQITTEMASNFDFDDIKLFFTRMGRARPQGSYSRAELVRAYLANCDDGAVLDVGDQLGLANQYKQGHGELGESKYWLLDHFRMFISHVHTAKKSAANLKSSLQNFGISTFVAHEDISVSEEWRDEILKSLLSMDGMIAVLTQDFGGSKWTDQEVGFAVCRDVLVIPLNKGLISYGFIEKYQALNTSGMSVGEVSEQVFRTVCANDKTKTKMIECLTKTMLSSPTIEVAKFRLEKLSTIADVKGEEWESIRENVQANETLRASEEFIAILNTKLHSLELDPISDEEPSQPSQDDEIPF